MNPKNLHFLSKGRLKRGISSSFLLSDDLLIVRAMIRLDIRNNGTAHRFKGSAKLFCLRFGVLNESTEIIRHNKRSSENFQTTFFD